MKKMTVIWCVVLVSLICFEGVLIAQVQEDWVARTSDTRPDTLLAVTTDSDGNVYVTGYRGGFTTDADILTVKYNDQGVQQWAQIYPDPSSGSLADIGRGILVDDSGNVYVVGETESATTGKDFIVIKYNSSGSVVSGWPAIYNGDSDGDDAGKDIAFDSSGNIVATGYSLSPSTGYDYATLKISAAGAFLWTNDAVLYDGTANGEDFVFSLAVDSLDNVYVTGSSEESCAGAGCKDYATVKYNSSGTYQWVCHKDGTASGDDLATDIGIDGSNYVYVTGYSAGTGTDDDYLTMKINPSTGNEMWSERYNNSSENGEDRAQAIAVHPSGLVHVTGRSDRGTTGFDYTTLKYGSSGGQPFWVSNYHGPSTGGLDEAFDVVVDRHQNVFVTGRSRDAAGSHYDYATLQYDPRGNEVWTQRYNGPQDETDVSYAIALDRSRNVYVTGSSTNDLLPDPDDQDGATIKYIPPTTPTNATQSFMLLLLD